MAGEYDNAVAGAAAAVGQDETKAILERTRKAGSGLHGVPDELVEDALSGILRRQPDAMRAFQNRDADPAGWSRVERMAAKLLADQADHIRSAPIGDRLLADPSETDPDYSIKLFRMSDKEFQQHTEDVLARTERAAAAKARQRGR